MSVSERLGPALPDARQFLEPMLPLPDIYEQRGPIGLAWGQQKMLAYALDAVRRAMTEAVRQERARIAENLRRSGATLPAPEVKGTPESGIITGLCIALTLVEDAPPLKSVELDDLGLPPLI